MTLLLDQSQTWRCAQNVAAEVIQCPKQDFFSKWDQEGTIDFAKTFSELIILTASRTLMGVRSFSLLRSTIREPLLAHEVSVDELAVSILLCFHARKPILLSGKAL